MELNQLFDSKLTSGLEELRENCEHVLHIIVNRKSTKNFSDFVEHHCGRPLEDEEGLESRLRQLFSLF